ncbi:hypothetical protein [Sinorhizobium meliloti]|uniref:hypothetical protein n=1 Tax=Rhizobium meliloti TaxID=382 RepID=UPI000FDAB7E3|nr:hypothetical protein [Sinorhizobium meliloti]RVH15324.1 hypothetical protein CN215_34605 [Sinorhizobium meliloti]RVO76234.1 hypothetical protein CN088_32785 [Sinorhizobium meliloti]RVQ07101.1 hypothetical protein CN063_33245 [Sinorhizobium meliloti]
MRTLIVQMLFLAILPTAAVAWDPVKDLTGKRLDEHLDHGRQEIERLPGSMVDCVQDPRQCAEDQLKRIPYQSISLIIERYKSHLFNQGEGRWKSLPQWLVVAAQPHYPEINLSSVRYAENVNTLHGRHIAWHYSIFYTRDINTDSSNDLHLMLHELEHVVQYERRGGEQPFLSEYVLKAPGKVLETGSFDVHDYIDIERAAEEKANNILGMVMQSRSIQASTALPTQTPPPNQPPTSAPFCYTLYGTCGMAVPVLPNSPCYCPSQGGPIWGTSGY